MNHSKPDLGIAETKPAAIRPHCLASSQELCGIARSDSLIYRAVENWDFLK